MAFSEKNFTGKTGIKTIYYDSGINVNKPALVFIHGGTSHPLKNYETILHTLAKNYRIIAPEVPGFTNTYYPDKLLGLDELATFFNELMEKAKLPQYSVIGHSMGGGIAILMATNNSRVLRVIASNSAGHPLQLSENGLAFSMVSKIIRQGYSKQGVKVFKKLYHGFKEIANGKMDKKNRTSFALKSAHYAMSKDYSDLFSKVASPTLLIHAKKDNLFKRPDAQYLSELIPKSTLVEVDGYHDWAMHEQDQFAKLTQDFLEKN
ncbi:MAG: alpha/beta hydrolase [Patescibacteria group bacterium]|nr:alpha/beta hydrolase [Patescibacteria group bacterium]